MTSGIYAIVNCQNGFTYVGQSVRMEQRRRDHWSALNRGIHTSPHLQNAWSKYGAEGFIFQILEVVDDLDRLTEREQFYMDHVEAEYNICPAAGSPRGFKHPPKSPELRAKLSAALMGHVPTRTGPMSEEHKAKISAAHKGRKRPGLNVGRVLSPETKAKIGAANRGKKNPAVSESNKRRAHANN